MATTAVLDRNTLEQDVKTACAKSAAGADLLISAFVAALRSNRRASVCAPFPSFLIDEQHNKDFKSATESIPHFPPTESIASSEYSDSKDAPNPVRKIPLPALTLLQWILKLKCQFELVHNLEEISESCLPNSPSQPSKQDFMLDKYIQPSHIFKLQHVDEHTGEELFQTAKEKYGSVMAFHGTTAENLHCILRCGLLNLSKSHLQRNGAMYGDGVYLSTDLGVANTFSKAGRTWEGSALGSRVRYILLCEVARGEDVTFSTVDTRDERMANGNQSSSVETHGTYIVVRNNQLIRIRCVLVYRDETEALQEDHLDHERNWVGSLQDTIRRNRHRVNWFSLSVLFYLGLLAFAALK